MYNRLLLGLLFLTLSWGFMGTFAQNNTTPATNATATTIAGGSTTPAAAVNSTSATTPVAMTTTGTSVGAGNTMTNGTTVGAGNTMTNGTTVGAGNTMTNGTTVGAGNTMTNGTTVGAGNTMTNGTTVGAGNTMTNGTTVGAGNTTTNGTTVGAGNTTANGTTVGAGNTTTNATTATTVSSTTTSPTTQTPVATLQTPISRTNCGSSKLCAASPATCNPDTGVGCSFLSAQQQSGQLYNFEVSGESSGYIAAGVSTSTNVNGLQQAYICANNNGNVRFFTGTITNLVLTLTQTNASNVKGAINSRKIQCTFAATLPDTTIRAADYSLSFSNGTYDPANEKFGQPSVLIFTSRVNLSDPTSNATNQINNGAYPATYQQSLIPALLVTVVMLTFSML